MTTRLQQRRDTAANWTSNNPTLAAGEIGLESDTGNFKIGNGSTAWTSLAYSSNLGTAVNAQTGTTYTFALSDANTTLVSLSNSSAITVTVPPNSSVAFPVGTSLSFYQGGAGQVTVAAGSGVTINYTPGLKLRAQWSSASLIQTAANTWLLSGDVTA